MGELDYDSINLINEKADPASNQVAVATLLCPAKQAFHYLHDKSS